MKLNSVPTLRFGGVPTEQRSFQGIPGIEVTEDAVWTTWYGGGSDEGTGNYVMVARSPLDGAGMPVWSEPTMWVEPDEDSRIFDSVLWVGPNGGLWLFFTQTSKAGANWDGRGGVWATRCDDPIRRPDHWTEPRRLGDGVMMNKPTVHSDGTWLLPIGIWDHPPYHESQEGRRRPYAVKVDDHMTTLEYGAGAPMPPRTFDEHVIIELAGGGLRMYVRSSPVMFQSESHDGGQTWDEGRPSDIPCADSRFALRALASGKWLLITNWMPDGEQPHDGPWGQRSYMSARLSSDDGETWSAPLMLHSEPVVSYPDFVEQGEWIWATWDRNRYTDSEILVSRFTETDVEAGSLDSSGSFANAVAAAAPSPSSGNGN
ncbi:MAG: sialidase family protein [Mycetocola sp.]